MGVAPIRFLFPGHRVPQASWRFPAFAVPLLILSFHRTENEISLLPTLIDRGPEWETAPGPVRTPLGGWH